MTRKFCIHQLILFLRRHLFALLRFSKQQWTNIVGRLFRLWGFGGGGGRSSGKEGGIPGTGGDPTFFNQGSTSEHAIVPTVPIYQSTKEGGTISLRGVAPSVYPSLPPGKDMRDPRRSTQSLNSYYKGHEVLVQRTRNTSRTSLVSRNSGMSGQNVGGSDYDLHRIASNSSQTRFGSNSHPTYFEAPSKGTPLQTVTDLPGEEEDVSLFSWPKDDIIAIMPDGLMRYNKHYTTPKQSEPVFLPPFPWDFRQDVFGWFQNGWKRRTHPEGARYFYHPLDQVFCDADLTREDIRCRAERDIQTTLQAARRANIPWPHPDFHLIFDVIEDDKGVLKSHYYFACHSKKIIFFLDDFDCQRMTAWKTVDGCRELSHMRVALETQYWFFLCMYPDPDAVKLAKPLVSELRDMAHHSIGDLMSSPSSIAPYTMADLEKILSWTASLDRNCDVVDSGWEAQPQESHQCATRDNRLHSAGSLSLIARLMFTFYDARFCHFYGEACARIERHNSVYGDPPNRRTWLVRIMSKMLFSAPDVHLRNLQHMWVDGIMHQAVWEDSVKKLNEEWQDFVLFGTILLNANIAFLAIQSVDVPDPLRTPAQVASYVSVVMSIGSILLGLLLIRQNRNRTKQSAPEMAKYLRQRTHPLIGLETLAILHSLPYALLMWSMVAFLTAFAFHCFMETHNRVRSIVGSVAAVVAILIFWCITNSWDRQDKSETPGLSEIGAVVEQKAKEGLQTLTRVFSHQSNIEIAFEAPEPSPEHSYPPGPPDLSRQRSNVSLGVSVDQTQVPLASQPTSASTEMRTAMNGVNSLV